MCRKGFRYRIYRYQRGTVAQSVEQVAVNHRVVGSSPTGPAIGHLHFVYGTLTVSSKKRQTKPFKRCTQQIFYIISIGLVNPVLQVRVLLAPEGAVA